MYNRVYSTKGLQMLIAGMFLIPINVPALNNQLIMANDSVLYRLILVVEKLHHGAIETNNKGPYVYKIILLITNLLVALCLLMIYDARSYLFTNAVLYILIYEY